MAIVLAGGAGKRMGPLTERRAKPALPFAGLYRLIDFPLSNCSNSGIEDVWVIQQYLPHSLEDHIANGRPWDLDRTSGGLLILHPFSGGEEGGFHEGNADALWRHRQLIREFDPDVVLVLSADAAYTLDYGDLLAVHRDAGADVTIATTEVEEDASRFGVVQLGDDGRVVDFAYKPEDPTGNRVAMEVFAYRPQPLLRALDELGQDEEGLEDFGDHLIPRLVSGGGAYGYDFRGYWRDVGTPQSYWQAHQDLLDQTNPRLDLDDRDWPIRTKAARRPPARISRTATVDNSLVSPACSVSGNVVRSVLSPGVVVEEGAVIDRAVVLHDCVIRSGAHVERAIVDSGVEVAAGDTVSSDDPDEPAVLAGRGDDKD